MKLGLGIDTGGTYTDAVLYDFENGQVTAGAKSLTTKEDLSLGICGALDKLPKELLSKVQLVSLSTTLATNACVEEKGGRAHLIFIGGYPKVVRENGTEYGLPPYDEISFLPGGCNRFGEVEQEPNFDLLFSQTAEWIDNTDAIAIVDHQGVANPIFEQKAKKLLEERFHIPVICGYELFGDYNYIKRGASTLLNAQLIPVIQEFLRAIQKALEQRGIQGAVVIMRSDGTLMRRDFAGQRQ